MKTVKIILKVLLAVLILLVAALAYLLITEHRPQAEEPALQGDIKTEQKITEKELTLLSFNIGYAGLGKAQDFFMDGGTRVEPFDKAEVEGNIAGVANILQQEAADIYLLQEVDIDSKRTYGINEMQALGKAVSMDSCFAYNYKCQFVPFPLPPIGKVAGGIMTMSRFGSEEDTRISLPASASWPVSAFYLKRCLMISYLPIEGSDKKLVICNLHLEAYDDGSAKEAQTKFLVDLLQEEYAKGNYVIAGGDFNQSTAAGFAAYPLLRDGLWAPPILAEDILPQDWQWAFDYSNPSCRSLDRAYDAAISDNQHYAIDGFILSPNVELVNVNTLDYGFEYSDHNPVKLQVKLK